MKVRQHKHRTEQDAVSKMPRDDTMAFPPQQEIPPLQLTLPDSQTISDGAICWYWKCCEDEITITAIFITKANADFDCTPGDFIVQLGFEGESEKHFSFRAKAAEEVAMVMLSARNWEFEWKKYAGDYLLQWLMPAPEVKHGEEISGFKSSIVDGVGNPL